MALIGSTSGIKGTEEKIQEDIYSGPYENSVGISVQLEKNRHCNKWCWETHYPSGRK